MKKRVPDFYTTLFQYLFIENPVQSMSEVHNTFKIFRS